MVARVHIRADPGSSRSRATGRPRGRPVEVAPDAGAFVGIHVGVRHTSVAVADALGRIRTTRAGAPFRGEAARALGELPDLAADVMREARLPRTRLLGVGVSVPGLVNPATGTCVLAPNLGWRNVAVREKLADAFRVPVAVRNSMQAAAIAEARLGAERAATSFAWMQIGSGIGAAIVLQGRVLYGTRGYTGELGHWKVLDGGALCGCGRRGCLETVASVDAIEGAYAATPRDVASARESTRLDVAAIAVAASHGDAAAQRVLTRAGDYLGIGISYLLNLLDLETVVLDGPAIRASDYLLERIRVSVARHTVHGQAIPIVKSIVGDDVILKGAVLLAKDGDRLDRATP